MVRVHYLQIFLQHKRTSFRPLPWTRINSFFQSGQLSRSCGCKCGKWYNYHRSEAKSLSSSPITSNLSVFYSAFNRYVLLVYIKVQNRPQLLTDILIAAETGDHASMVTLLRQSKIGKVEIEDVVRITFFIFKGSLWSLSSRIAVLYDCVILLQH